MGKPHRMPVERLAHKIGTARQIAYCVHKSNNQNHMTTTNTATTYNGWANYETWNAALWIGNDEFLYNTAKACVEYVNEGDTPWAKFQRCMMDGQIGRYLGATGDGVAWDHPAIDAAEMEDMMQDL